MGAISRKFANNFTTGGVFTSSAIVNASLNNVTDIPSAAKGKLVLLSTATASSSASLEFNSTYINSSYSIYKFEFINIHPATNLVQFRINFTTDGTNYNVTKTTTMFYAYHAEDDSLTGFSYSTPRDLAQSTADHNIVGAGSDLGNANDDNCAGEVYLFNPSSTTYVKHFLTKASSNSGEGYPFTNYTAGYANTTSALVGVKFVMSSGNIDAGTIRLYGIE